MLFINVHMGLPSKRRTTRSKRERNSHAALKKVASVQCENCKAPVLPHRACANCGHYKKKRAINVEKRTTRRTRRVKRLSR